MGVDGSIYLGLSLKMGLFFEAKLIFHQSKLGIWHMKNEYCMFFYWITYFLHQIEVRQSACWFFFKSWTWQLYKVLELFGAKPCADPKELSGLVDQAFAEQNVYVFLELHDDAFTTTNGGEGLPWWTGAYMQETAHAHSTSGHCCIFTKPSYITKPGRWICWMLMGSSP